MLECMLAVSDRAKFGQDKYVSLSVPLLRAVYNFTTHQIDDGTCGVNRVRVIGTQLWLYGGYSNGGAGGYNDGGVIGPRLIGSCAGSLLVARHGGCILRGRRQNDGATGLSNEGSAR